MCDEYNPSRRSSAPRSCAVPASYARNICRFCSLLNRRRSAWGFTSILVWVMSCVVIWLVVFQASAGSTLAIFWLQGVALIYRPPYLNLAFVFVQSSLTQRDALAHVANDTTGIVIFAEI